MSLMSRGTAYAVLSHPGIQKRWEVSKQGLCQGQMTMHQLERRNKRWCPCMTATTTMMHPLLLLFLLLLLLLLMMVMTKCNRLTSVWPLAAQGNHLPIAFKQQKNAGRSAVRCGWCLIKLGHWVQAAHLISDCNSFMSDGSIQELISHVTPPRDLV